MRHKADAKTICKSILGGLTALLFFVFCSGEAMAAPTVSAQACALLELSGRVLYEENAEAKLPMASTTKVMTAILAIENGNFSDVVTVSENAAGIEGSSMYLSAGETITLEDLVYGLMLASGNDAAYAIAEHIGGSAEQFIEMMNNKAQEIGAAGTHFVTPNGLHDEAHYTTAKDLAKIACYAMQNETFCDVVATTSKDLPADEDSPARYLRSKNKILYLYEGGNGIKTGYTKAAGKCLVAGAQREGMQLVSVVLNDYDMFEDSMELLDYGFANYQMQRLASSGDVFGEVPVEGGVKDLVSVAISEDISLPLRENEGTMVKTTVDLPEKLEAPVEAGEVIGSVTFYLNEEVSVQADLCTQEAIQEKTFRHHLARVMDIWLGLNGEKNENREVFGVSGGSF